MQVVAPAGSISGLKASIKGGADAVYLGLPLFGARAKAENFDCEKLKYAIEFAHLFGVKVFITLNTLIKDSELPKAVAMAKEAYDLGADAAIVQDIRFVKKLKHEIPDFTLHASTQMGIHNADGAKILTDLGIKRAVLARETLPEDIAKIKQTTDIEIEYFVQGALCVSFSGNCYFSSLASSYSGNRGKCMQLCRKPYFFGGKRGYFLSAKDLCLYEKLGFLESLGVDAIKIEGRMRSDEYAYTAVSVYKSMCDKTPIQSLKSVFNRGDYCTAYTESNAPFNVIYPKIQGNIGVYIGKINAVKGSDVVVKGFVPHDKDGFKIIRAGHEVCGATVRGGKIVADGNCSVGDDIRRTFDGSISDSIKAVDRNLDIDVHVALSANKSPIVTVSRNGTVITTVFGNFLPQQAKSHALSVSDVARVFEKVSEYPYSPKITVDIDGELFMPVSALNELRRNAYGSTHTAILANYKISRSKLPYIGLNYNRFDGHGTLLMIENERQLTDEILSYADYIVLNPRDYSNFSIPTTDKKILLNTPITMRGKDKAVIRHAIDRPEIFGIVSNNYYTLSLADKPILLGTGHNIIGECDYPHITSFESDSVGNGFAYVFGYAPIMTLCHCPYGKCINCSGSDELKDENGRVFKLRRYTADHCYWQLLNCVPHYLDKIAAPDKFFDCTACGKEEILSALKFEYVGNFTRGNFNKGLK